MDDELDQFFETQPLAGDKPASDYDAFFAFERERQDQAARQNVVGSLGAKPDHVGASATTGRALGVPPAAVETDLPTFQELLQMRRNTQYVEKNEDLARWLAGDADRARVASDDFDKLDVVTKGFKAISTGWTSAFVYNQRMRDQAKKELGLSVDEAGMNALDKRLADSPKLTGVYGALSTATGFAGGLLDSMFRAGDETASGAAAGALLGGGLTAEVGGVGAAPGALAGAVIGFNVGWMHDQSLIAAGSTYLATEKVRSADGQPLDPAARHMAAALVYLGSYALNYAGFSSVKASATEALSRIVTEAAAKPTVARALSQFGKSMAKSGLEGAGIFGAMAGVEIFAEEFAKQYSDGDFEGLFNSEVARDDAVNRLISAAAMGAAFMPLVKSSIGGEGWALATDIMRARQVEQQVKLLQELEKGATESKTRTRDMEAFLALAKMQTDGSPVEEIGIPVGRVLELYQSLKLEPGKDDGVFGQFVSDIKEQIDQAKETNGDVLIPLSGYITHLAGSDIAKAVSNDLRFRPDGMTLREAQTYLKERGSLLEANAVDYQFTLDQLFTREEPVQKVYDDAFSKMRQAGHTIDAAKQYAALYAARYRARAERLGGTGDAFDLYKAEGIEIKRELPPMLRRVKVDYRDMVIEALRKGTDLPTDKQLFGPTLIEAIRKRGGIVDSSGELKALELDNVKEGRGVIRKPKKGEKKSGNSLDETALALWEQGYFGERSERPSIQDLIDAISDELAGNKRYQFGTDREAETMFREAVKDLEDFVGRNNIDLKETSNAQLKRALTQFEKSAATEGKEFKQQERGKISLGDGKAIITLFRDADLSTVLHETGHLWLDEMQRDYLDVMQQSRDSGDPATGQALEVGASVKADFEAIMKWMGVEAPADIKVEHHEKFARAFEAYLLEGKAPSTALGRAFKAFRSWLVRIYQDIAALATPINDDLRGVFDRMIATDDELARVREREAMNPAFASPEDAGMTKAEFNAYTKKVAKAIDDGDKALLEKTMKTVRAARTKEWQDQRKALREEIAPGVLNRRDLRAEYWLRSGRPLNGVPMPEGMEHLRLSRDAMRAMYGNDETFKMLPRGVTQAEGGLHPDDAALLFGYKNGDEMVQDLMSLEATRRGEEATIGKRLDGRNGLAYVDHTINRATDEKMLERHGDALNDGSIEEEAIAAVHNKAQAEVLAIELRAIARKLGRTPLQLVDLKAWVYEHLAAMPVKRATNADSFIRQEGANGREVQRALLKGDYRNAFILKQRQLLNHLMVAASREASDDFISAQKMFTRLAGKAQHKGIDAGYVDQIHAILKRIGYPVRRQDAELLAGLDGKTLREFVQEKTDEGRDILVPEFLMDQMWSKTSRNMTLDEMGGIYEAVQSLVHNGRLEKHYQLETKELEFINLRDEGLVQLALLPKMKDEAVTKAGTVIRSPDVASGRFDAARAKVFQYKTSLREFVSSLRKIEALVDLLDSEKASGFFNTYVFKPIAAREAWERDKLKEVHAKWLSLIDGMPKEWRSSLSAGRINTPELKRKTDGGSWDFDKGELLVMAHNLANDSNLAKMLKGEMWDEASVMAVLNRHLTEDDWHFVEKSLEIINSLYDDIDAMERRLTGVGIKKIEPREINTPFGTIQGGYFPMFYDAKLSAEIEAKKRSSASKMFDDNYTRALTPHGHTKARSEGFAAPLDFKFGRVAAHLEEVIHDLAFREVIMSVDKLMADKQLRAAIVGAIGKENYDQFRPWLQHIANERARDQRGLSWWDRFAKTVRVNATMVGLGLRASVGTQQFAGFANAAEMLGAKYVAKGLREVGGIATPAELASGLARTAAKTRAGRALGFKYLAQGIDAIANDPRKFEDARAFVVERSGELRHRWESLDRDMRTLAQDLVGKKGIKAEVQRYAYIHIGLADQMVVIPTWLGGYRKALDSGASEADAIYYADKVVRLTQGTGSAKDLAAIARPHNPWMSLITMFYTYMSAYLNRQASVAKQGASGVRALARGDFKKARYDLPAALARSWWLMVVSVLGADLLAGRGPEDDEDVASWALRRITFNAFGGVPLARDVAGIVERQVSGKPSSDFRLSPAERMVDVGLRSLGDAKALFTDDDVSDKWLKHSLETSGYFLGLPGGQAGTTAQYLWDVAQGDEQPETASEFMGSAMFGPKKKE